MGMPTATVKLCGPDGMMRICSAVGTGPVDAAYKAVDSLVRVNAELVDYSVNSVTAGIEALAITRVRLLTCPALPSSLHGVLNGQRRGSRFMWCTAASNNGSSEC